MDVVVFSVTDRDRMEAALVVRRAVFVDEQHVPIEEEIDDHDRDDPDARHIVVTDGGVPLAAGRFYRRDAETVQIGRMAVLAEHRGRGLGRLMLDALMADARERGYRRASLNAQVHALAFYAKAGFVAHGPPFEECEILHRAMEKPL
jgi:predicted GNAT family N-acyltransferase